MIDKNRIWAILFDNFLGKLSEVETRKDYVFKECRKVLRKQERSNNLDAINHYKHYQVANEAWKLAQSKLEATEYSVAAVLWFTLQKQPSIIKYFKLNIKSFERLKNNHDISKHTLRALKIINVIDDCVDLKVSQYNYRENKKQYDKIK